MDLVVRVILQQSVGDLSQAQSLLGVHHQAHNAHPVYYDGADLIITLIQYNYLLQL